MQVVRWGNKEERTTVMSKLVMIIDDSLTVRKIMETSLKREGFASVSYPDGIEALRALSEGLPIPDLVLLDIGLPKMDGYEIARRLRQRPLLKDVWLIALTGYGQDSDRQRSKEAGFDHHLVKPVDPQKLEELLAALIKLPRSAKAN